MQKKLDKASFKISPKDNSDTVARKTISAYLAGYNLIYMRAEKHTLSTKQRQNIKVFARRMLVGTEIVTDTPHELTLQVLLSYPEFSIQSALRRMSIIASSMHKDAITALKTRNSTLAKEVSTTDNEVDRFNLFVIRQLKMTNQNPRIAKDFGIATEKEYIDYRLVSKSIERTADHAVKISDNAAILKDDLTDEAKQKIDDMSTIAVTMFENAVESLFRHDYCLAESILEKHKEILVLEKEAIVSSQIGLGDVATMRLIIESIRRTAEYACDIAETVLNLTVESILA
jgi:phosphate uptake regulator